MKTGIRPLLLTSAVSLLCVVSAKRAGAQGPGVAVFDTIVPSAVALSPEAVTTKTGWVKRTEAEATAPFKGDTVMSNGRLLVVLRRGSAGAELYGDGNGNCREIARLSLITGNAAASLMAIKATAVADDSAQVDASFDTQGGTMAATFEVALRGPFVRMMAQETGVVLRVAAPCRYAVVPDMAKGKEDVLFDATKAATPIVKATGGNFLLHLAGRGDVILTLARDMRDCEISLATGEGNKEFSASETPFGKQGQIWVSVLEGQGLWRESAAGDVKEPFAAQWREAAGQPGVIYARDRVQKTPLTQMTVIDAIRTAMGAGPCHYILDLDEVLTNIGLQTAKTSTNKVAMSREDIAAWLGKENEKQKQLRQELAALSKTDQRIYYSTTFEGIRKIYSVSPDGTGFKCLTPADWKGEQDYPHVSPDGKKMILTGGQKLTDAEYASLPSDTNYLFGAKTRWNRAPIVWLANVDGTDAKPLVIGSCPHWSWDGKYIGYGVQPMPNVRCLGLLDVEQKKEWIFKGGGGNTPCFTPDGKYYICGASTIESFKIEDIIALGARAPKTFNCFGCNQEMSQDGKWLARTIDRSDGSWLQYAAYEPQKNINGAMKNLELGVPWKTMNYQPDFSPGDKYIVWAHWETWKDMGSKSANVYNTDKGDLYVCRFPADGVSVRITWHGGTTFWPQWWGSEKYAVRPPAPAPIAATPGE